MRLGTRTILAWPAMLALALGGQPASRRQEAAAPSAPEVRALVDRVIANQHRNDEALSEYERRERRQLRKDDKDLRIKEDKTFRIVPTGTGTLKLLVEENAQPVSAELYRRELRDLEQALVWALRPGESRQRQRVEKWNRRVRERAEMVDALREGFLYTWQGRETLNGRTVAKIALEPNPAFQAHSRGTELFRHVRATVWIDESAAQLVRTEAEIFTDISIGGGILGKIYHGGKFVLEQAPVAEGVWLPTRYQYDYEGRRFIFGFDLHELTLANGYRRIGPPKEALAAVRHELSNTSSADPAR